MDIYTRSRNGEADRRTSKANLGHTYYGGTIGRSRGCGGLRVSSPLSTVAITVAQHKSPLHFNCKSISFLFSPPYLNPNPTLGGTLF
jgi:hypothetical protein